MCVQEIIIPNNATIIFRISARDRRKRTRKKSDIEGTCVNNAEMQSVPPTYRPAYLVYVYIAELFWGTIHDLLTRLTVLKYVLL